MVDTSLMNVSISAVVDDLHTTVSSVQAAIALEALVSAAFILIGNWEIDQAQRPTSSACSATPWRAGDDCRPDIAAVIIFWAIIGGLGASMLLPGMQALIHGT